MINKQRLLNTFLDYVRIDSESRDEKAMAERLCADLAAIGCEIYVDKTMDKTGSNTGNVYATLPGTATGESVLLCAHMDTVVPGGHIFIDSTLITAKVERTDVQVHYIPATQMAKDAGFSTLANMILTGKVLKEIDAVTFEGNKETLESFIPAKKAGLIDINCQALQAGYDY